MTNNSGTYKGREQKVSRALTTRDVAQRCQVTQRTVVQWINQGKIKVFRTPGNHIRINQADFLDFLYRYDIPLPEDMNVMGVKKKVLVVDDDPGIVTAIVRTLQQDQDVEVETAGDGFNAGQKFLVMKPDLVVLDIQMPGMDGWQVCDSIRSNPLNNDVKIVVISGQKDLKRKGDARQHKADDYISKPIEYGDLRRRIRNFLGLSLK